MRKLHRGVAKLGIALGSGPRGLGFKSPHSAQFQSPGDLGNKVLRAFYFFRIAHIMLVSIKKLEKHFIAPKARWCLHETGGALCATPACEVRGFTNEKF